MKKLLAALRLVLADLSGLSKPAVASAVAGIVVPIAVAVCGVHVTAAEVGGWLIIAGGVAATLQKLTAIAPPAPAPAPAAKSKAKG